MSINKILNRPMFRKEALKKGHLKTINAQTGIMVGAPTGSPFPAVVRGQGVFSPVNTQRFGPPKPTRMQNFMRNPLIRGSGALIRGGVNIPSVGGYIAGDKVAQGLGIEDPLGRGVFGLGGSYAATRALPALAGIGFMPSLVGLGAIAGIQNRVKAGIAERKRINAMSPEERAEFSRQNRLKATDIMSEGVSDQDLFGKFVPKPPEEFKPRTSAAPKEGPGSGRNFFRNKSAELKAEGDQLLQDNVAKDDVANLDSVQEASLGNIGPVPPGDEGVKVTTSKVEQITEEPKKKKDPVTTEITTGGISDDKQFDANIKLAKKYFAELNEGQSSQANLVFLSNLASGLLTGTTRKSGIGGALEVFGQAIGPAVNNYATIKLKEGEIRANRRETSLNAALDHMKFLNDAAQVDRPDVDPGVIQIRGTNGDLQNFNGYIGKDGTTYIPGGLGSDGRQSLSPIAQGGMLKDSGPDGVLGTEDDIELGRFEKFLKQDKISSRLSDLEDTLGNRYTAYSVTLDILDTIKKTDEKGNLVKPGVALTLDTYLRRIGNAASDLVGRNIVAENLKDAEKTLEDYYQSEVDAINRDPELSEKQKENDIAAIDKDKLKDAILNDKKGVGWFSGLSAKDQEKLAVQETSLVYALANTFKDQDRLTQRDINAAREIVNLFAIGRGGQDVRDSIEAIAGQLRADIRRQELLYTSSGGLYSTIQDLKALAEYDTKTADEKVKEAFGLSEKEIKEKIDKMELK